MEKSEEGTPQRREAAQEPRTVGPSDEQWSTAGPSARAPGAEIPDEQIRQDVCDRLVQFGPADCTALEVEVSEGVVSVAGTLASEALRDRLFEVIRTVAGVRDIDDGLRIAAP